MTHLNNADGLEDPFTGPQTPSARSSRSTTVRARGQPTMSALSQAMSSRLNSAKTRSSPAQEHKVASSSPPPPGRPSARTLDQPNGNTMALNLMTTLGARPAAASRSFSASTTSSSRDAINNGQVTQRRSASGLPTSSILTSNNGAQRSLSGPIRGSSHPAIRSNVRKSLVGDNQTSPISAAQTLPHPSMSTNILPHAPAASQASQLDPHSVVPTNMLAQAQNLSPVPTVAAIHQPPPVQAGHVPFLNRFTIFPKLPTELQQEIWSIAIAFQYYQEKRLLRVAPDPKSLDRTDDDAEVAQLRIISDIHRRPRLVPSLLHVCQYTRNEAIKGYELWGCADPITYEKNSSKVYVKVDVDAFFFGDADLGDFWAFHTFIKESEPENASADDTARGRLIEQIGLIKHFTFDYELCVQMLEYDSLWLANLDSANQITVAIRNPNHEQFRKDYALSHLKMIVQSTFAEEAAQIIRHMISSSIAASGPELQGLNWPENGLLVNVQTLAMGNATGNTPEDESYLEDVLIEGNRAGVVSDHYLEFRLAIIHANQAPQPPPAPVPTQNN